MITCPIHPKYRGARAPRSVKPGCTCAEVYAAAHLAPTRVLAIDPGASPGFAWIDTDPLQGDGIGVSAFCADAESDEPWDEVVIEDQFLTKTIFRNGRKIRVSPKSQITLIRTAERMLLTHPATRQYRMAPSAWRGVLWPGSNRLPKSTVLARLRRDEPELLAGATDDAVEARGILRAFLSLTPAQKKRYLIK